MGTENIYIIIILVISVIINILVYLKLMKKDTLESCEDPNTQAHIILIDRKLTQIQSDIHDLAEKIEQADKFQLVEMDETTSLVKSGMSIAQIAKKMNKSIKEVELMLKMRGLI